MQRRTFLSLLVVVPSAHSAATHPMEKALDHLFNFDFPAAVTATADSLHDPIAHIVRAAAHLFAEFVNLNIWAGEDFFASGRRSKSKPDPALRSSFYAAINETRRLAEAALAKNSQDTAALFAYMISYSLETDYVAYVERHSLASFDLCKKSQVWADKLLAADPQSHDAYLTTGLNEYMLGALPGVVRWAVKIETAKGDKQKGLTHLEMAARQSRYFAPFAKLLLAVFYEREKQFPKALAMLQDLSTAYPKNQMFAAQLARLRNKKG